VCRDVIGRSLVRIYHVFGEASVDLFGKHRKRKQFDSSKDL